jgi:hypothetical protein
MGQYTALLSFTRNGKSYVHGDVVDLPDAEPEELRNVGMLLHYGVVSALVEKVEPQPDEKSGSAQK